jgi:hypothetical protein
MKRMRATALLSAIGATAWRLALTLLIAFSAPHATYAHKPSDSYLTLKVDGERIDGRGTSRSAISTMRSRSMRTGTARSHGAK